MKKSVIIYAVSITAVLAVGIIIGRNFSFNSSKFPNDSTNVISVSDTSETVINTNIQSDDISESMLLGLEPNPNKPSDWENYIAKPKPSDYCLNIILKSGHPYLFELNSKAKEVWGEYDILDVMLPDSEIPDEAFETFSNNKIVVFAHGIPIKDGSDYVLDSFTLELGGVDLNIAKNIAKEYFPTNISDNLIFDGSSRYLVSSLFENRVYYSSFYKTKNTDIIRNIITDNGKMSSFEEEQALISAGYGNMHSDDIDKEAVTSLYNGFVVTLISSETDELLIDSIIIQSRYLHDFLKDNYGTPVAWNCDYLSMN